MPAQFEFDVFHGQLAPNLAHVYARVASLPGGGQWKLSGQLRGPDCLFAKTLPVTVPFVDTGPGPTLLAQATLADPCFWSSDLPFLYRVHLELRHAGEVVATQEQVLGLRFLGRRQRFFYWANQRWVLRGVSRDQAIESSWSAWRELATTMIVSTPDDELCREASRQGVVLAAIMPASVSRSVVRRLAQWPAVAMVFFESEPVALDRLQPSAFNLMLGTIHREANVEIPGWSQGGLIEASRIPAAIENTNRRPLPLIAYRPLRDEMPLAAARAACDALQRDMVVHGDLAGYVV